MRGAELNIFARLLKTPMITVVGKYLSTVEFFSVEEMIHDQGIKNGFCESLDITGIMVQAMRRDRLCIICNRTCKNWVQSPDPSCPSRIIMGHQGCVKKEHLDLYGSIKKRYKKERPRIMYVELPIFKPFVYYKWRNIRIDSWFTKENRKTRNRVAGLPSTMEGVVELNDRFHKLAKRIMVNMFNLTEDERVLVVKQIFKDFSYGHYGFLRQIVEMMQDEVQVKNTFILHSRKIRMTGRFFNAFQWMGTVFV